MKNHIDSLGGRAMGKHVTSVTFESGEDKITVLVDQKATGRVSILVRNGSKAAQFASVIVKLVAVIVAIVNIVLRTG